MPTINLHMPCTLLDSPESSHKEWLSPLDWRGSEEKWRLYKRVI